MDEVFRAAARRALVEWGQEDGLEDLVSDIWVWYLERPQTQEKLAPLELHEQIKTVKLAVFQMLSERALTSNSFNGRNLYSSEAVKDVLKCRSSNRYLKDIMPVALKALESQSSEYAEAIRRRYEDGIFPSGKASDELLHAHKSLTEQVNIIVITADADAEDRSRPGNAAAVDPDTRRASRSSHKDPTGDMAMALIDHGDEEIDVVDRDGYVVGMTTLRREFEG